jgi:SAM-dependent methyltransferase
MFQSAGEARACTKGDVVLVQDSLTELISNSAFHPEVMQYDAAYHNEQSFSSVFQSHLDEVSRIILKHFRGCSLIEVGCGKGHFLELLQRLGFKIAGLDPTYEGSNPCVIREYFRAGCGLTGDGMILRHVLEHVQDPVAFLSQIRDANGGRGKVYIEVPCFDWICERRAWFDIFYEHVNYFRLSDFHRMFGTVYEAGRVFYGQYLYAVADLATIRMPISERSKRFEFPVDFLAGVKRYAAMLNERKSACRAVWGAASKGVIFALFMERAGAKIDMIIDINPAKQGKFLAGTGLQVQSPEAAMERLPDHAQLYVMNGNYLEEIKTLTKARFDYVTVDHE